MTNKMWVDVPSGWRYGFPKLFDPGSDGDLSEWIRNQGYPPNEGLDWARTWPADNEKRS